LTHELKLTEIHPGVHELRLPIPFEDGVVNCFLLTGEGHVDMIDCGMRQDESVDLIREALRRLGGTLRRLVVTHIHPDHYGAAGVLINEFGAELYLHRLEIPLVHPRYLELETLVGEVGQWLELNGVPGPEADEMKNASRSLRDFVQPGNVAVQLDGAETLELGNRSLRVEWTPGHSPGHICLFDADDGLLFAGDQLLPELSPNIGLHPQSTPNPLDEYMTALVRLRDLEPSLVLPAHGRPFSDVGPRVEKMLSHHRRRKEQIVEIVGVRECSAWQVAVEVWGAHRNVYEKRLMLQEALAHLQSLAVDGSLVKAVSAKAVRWRRPRKA
jgi:glyoxylase-like metal-dependent hydrolase (beta-lactamase superfamily II)